MKNIKKTPVTLSNLAFLLAVLLHTSFVADQGAISGKLDGKDGTVIKMQYRYEGVDRTDSTILKANQFAFDTNFPETVVCTLSNSANQQIRIFIAQNKPIHISGAVDKFHALQINGATEHELFEGFKTKAYALSGTYRKLLDASGGDRKDKQNPHYLKYKASVDSVTFDFVKRNKSLAVAALAIIDSYLNNADRKNAKIAYAMLSTEAKSGTYAKRVKQFIDTENTIKKGNLAPTFTLNNLKGKAVTLNEFRGRYVLLDFWASWCPPCRAEHPLLRKLQAKYGQNIEFISISMDASVSSWQQAVKVDSLTWTQLNDPRSTNGEVADSYGFKSLPFNCIVDPDGKIVATQLRGHNLEAFLSKLFAQ